MLKKLLMKAKAKHRKSAGSIVGLSAADKEDIAAMREDGMMPSAIAEDLGLNPQQVARCLELNKVREARRSKGAADNPIADGKLELQKLELEMRKQELEWKIEDKKADREQDLAEAVQDQVFPEGESQSEYAPLIQSFLMGLVRGGTTPGAAPGFQADQPYQPGVLLPGQPAPGNPPPADQKTDMTADEIDAILDQHADHVAQVQRYPDTVLDKLIKMQFPFLSDESRATAVQCIKKRKVKKHGR